MNEKMQKLIKIKKENGKLELGLGMEKWKWENGNGKIKMGKWKWENENGKMDAMDGCVQYSQVLCKNWFPS